VRTKLLCTTIALLLLVNGAAARAATIAPTTAADQFGEDAAQCALREAVQAANSDVLFGGCPAGSGLDTIPLSGGVVYGLTRSGAPENNSLSGDLDITSDLMITNDGTGPAVIDGSAAGDRVLHLLNGATTIQRVTISGGRAGSGAGGGIYAYSGTLDLEDSTISGNSGGFGGGIAGADTVQLRNVTIFGNQSTVSGGGFAKAPNGAIATFNNVTVAGNTADSDAGGTAGDGGGVALVGTVSPLTMKNTIVAGNVDATPAPGTNAPDCDTSPFSLGHNLIGDPANCGYSASSSDLVGVDPLLGPLAANGGPTPTEALRAGSPAINAGGVDCAPADQRGATRSHCDLGAYERITCGGRLVTLVGTSGHDVLTGTGGADGILLGGGKDLANGLGGADGICGGGGKDRLRGGSGKDRLLGQAGRDKLIGGGGVDLLNGGAGRDRCKGGPGKDRERGCE
jgi:CSLREA domain-containing protein